MRYPRTGAVLLAVLALSCKPYSPRPFYPPVTGAPVGEINLTVPVATSALADVFRGDSFPLRRVELGDGYIETDWFEAGTKQPTRARRLGPGIIQVRAWVDPAKTGSSRMTVETVFRPLADPSLPDRALDRQVPADHPTAKRVAEIVGELVKLYAPEAAE
jgi:hypothetical protein